MGGFNLPDAGAVDPGAMMKRRGLLGSLLNVQPEDSGWAINDSFGADGGSPKLHDLVYHGGARTQSADHVEDDAATRQNTEIANSSGESFADEAPKMAGAMRASLADQVRSQSGAQPSRLDQMQQQYDRLGQQIDAPPQKMGLLKTLVLGALAGPKAGEAYRTRQQGEEFQQNQLRERQNSLLQQIEAERRMQGEQGRQDQSEEFQERMANQRHQWDMQDPAKIQTMQTEQGSFERDPATGAWRPIQAGGQPIGGKATQKPDSLEAQYDEAIKGGDQNRSNQLLQEMQAIGGAKQPPQRDPRPPQQLGVTPDGTVVDIKPGMRLPEGTQSLGGEMKTQQGQEGANADIAFANNYLQSGKFDGPHDEALIEKFFDMSKPSSGFRMTQPQIDMALHARSLLQSVGARAKHMFSPSAPYLDDTQRANIIQTMNDLMTARGGSGKQQNLKSQVQNVAPEGTRVQRGNQILVKQNGKWVPEQQ